MFDGRWRSKVDRRTGPVGQWLQAHKVTADVLTISGLVTASATAVVVANGWFLAAVVLLTLTGAHDLFDGPVAKAAGTSSVRGAFLDSVTDRVADAVIMSGVAWYLLSSGHGHLVLLPFAIMAVTQLISYERAKAEALGISAKGGLMERAERMILLGVGFLLPFLLIPILWVLLVLTAATAIGRFARVFAAAEGPASKKVTTSPRRMSDEEPSWRRWLEPGGENVPALTDRWRTRRQDLMARRTGRALTARRARRAARAAHGTRSTTRPPR